jgi:uncharacterized membrane protein YeaQ/YmgE (transglycosylase-associated protein family)
MSWLWFILFGFIIGLLARALVPGRQHLGIIWTTLLGIGGSLLGGFIANAISGGPLLELHTAGWIGSIIGAIVLLLLFVGFNRRRHVAHPVP